MTMLLLPMFLLFAAAPAQPPVYSGVVRIPVALASAPAGTYRIEVQGPVLRFFEASGGQKRLEVQAATERQGVEGLVPLAGAQFLRSSEDPLPTGQERQFSKTGAPQYAEEKRDWKGVLRLYRKPGAGNEAWLIFSERGPGNNWTATPFKMTIVAGD